MARQTRATSKAAKTAKRDADTTNRNDRRKSSTKFPTPAQQKRYSSSDTDELADAIIEYPRLPKLSRQSIGRRQSEAYEADNEGTPGTRRFSYLYGHGHQLPHPARSSIGKKRKVSADSEESSPKKVRFGAANETREIQDGRVKSVPVPSPVPLFDSSNSTTDETQADEDGLLEDLDESDGDPDGYLIDAVKYGPQQLSLSQAAVLFRDLQDWTLESSKMFFGRTDDDNDETIAQNMAAFPLHDLENKFPALYRTTLKVLDASTTDGVDHGWLKFFAHPDYRPYLVYAILGEWFTQRVFKDTTFGLDDETQKKMKRIDVEYIHHESFIRAKKRANLLKGYNSEQLPWPQTDIFDAADKLTDELLIVLAPLFPKGSKMFSKEGGKPESDYQAVLRNLVASCANIQLSLIRSGSDGTIFRIADTLQKGTPYWPTAPMRCINKRVIDETPDGSLGGKNEELVVKMTCFGRVEAYVPHGMDMQEMHDEEMKIRRRSEQNVSDQTEAQHVPEDRSDNINDKFCWECSGAGDRWDVLPRECWAYETQHRQKQEMQLKDAEYRQQLGEGEQDDLDPDSSESENETPSSSSSDSASTSSATIPTDDLFRRVPRATTTTKPLRGSWVTIYDCITPHTVYCEWTKPHTKYHAGKDIRKTNGLKAAIAKARAEQPFPASLENTIEDTQQRLWNLYAANNLKIEWGTFLIALVCGITRRTPSSLVGSVLATSLGVTAAMIRQIMNIPGLRDLTSVLFEGHSADSSHHHQRNNLSLMHSALKQTLLSVQHDATNAGRSALENANAVIWKVLSVFFITDEVDLTEEAEISAQAVASTIATAMSSTLAAAPVAASLISMTAATGAEAVMSTNIATPSTDGVEPATYDTHVDSVIESTSTSMDATTSTNVVKSLLSKFWAGTPEPSAVPSSSSPSSSSRSKSRTIMPIDPMSTSDLQDTIDEPVAEESITTTSTPVGTETVTAEQEVPVETQRVTETGGLRTLTYRQGDVLVFEPAGKEEDAEVWIEKRRVRERWW